jgi:hypothetical protein
VAQEKLEAHQVAQVHQEAQALVLEALEELHQEAQALVLDQVVEGLEAQSQVSQELMLIRQLALVQLLLKQIINRQSLSLLQITQLH